MEILGLSGGIDSALTLAIASEIFDKKDIEAILMPSEYTRLKYSVSKGTV